MKQSLKSRTVKFSFLILAFLNPLLSAEKSNVFLHSAQIGSEKEIIALADIGIGEKYTALLSADASKEGAVPLTFFPSHIEFLQKDGSIKIKNSFGTAVFDSKNKNIKLKEKSGFFSFFSMPEKISADGEWSAFVRRNGVAKGALTVRKISTGETRILDSDANLDFRKIPVKWENGGSILLYEKGDSVYFCEPSALFSSLQVDERYRFLGEGGISSFEWAGFKSIFRISGDIVYKINAEQLNTRALYQPLVGGGEAVCRLPSAFNPKKDRFWVSEDESSFVILTANSIVSVFRSVVGETERFELSSVDFIPNSVSILDCKILWTSALPLLWVRTFDSSVIYSVGSKIEEILDSDSTIAPSVSPDGKSIALVSGKSLFVRDLKTLKIKGKLGGESILSFAWRDKDSIVAGGSSSVREWNIDSSSAKTLCLSSVKDAVFRNGAILAETQDERFFEIKNENGAVSYKRVEFAREDFLKIKRQIQNGFYRVYAKDGGTALLVRDLAGAGNNRTIWQSFSKKRRNQKKIRLAIDALDDAEGLDFVLAVLARYRIKATFFLNGEFIRRYPDETKKIAQSGHICASMFFAAADFQNLAESGYVIDEEFVRRGLSRNEDEFFSATGKELSLLWHAPFYSAEKSFFDAGKKSGYEYINAKPLDSSTFERLQQGKPYWTVSQIISAVVSNPPEVVPISLGRARGTRLDFLWEKIDILIFEMLLSGVEFDSL